MKLRVLAAGLLLAILPLASAPAQELNIINNPAEPNVVGANPRLRDDPGVQGGKAMRIQVRRRGANVWDVAVESAINKPIKAGDSLLFAFWARLEKGPDGATTATLPFNGLQLSAAPYSTVFNSPIEIGPEWKLHEVEGRADKDYAAGTLKAVVHLATAEQTLDVGPLIVVDLGQ